MGRDSVESILGKRHCADLDTDICFAKSGDDFWSQWHFQESQMLDTEMFYLVMTTMGYPQNDAILSFLLTCLQRHKDFSGRRPAVLWNMQCRFQRWMQFFFLRSSEQQQSFTSFCNISCFTLSPKRTHEKVAKREKSYFWMTTLWKALWQVLSFTSHNYLTQ